jgi:hypothetical protein
MVGNRNGRNEPCVGLIITQESENSSCLKTGRVFVFLRVVSIVLCERSMLRFVNGISDEYEYDAGIL